MSSIVWVICAHNDDQIIGAGGTLAKYAKEGKQVETYVMSFGEASHMHFKAEITAEMRAKESFESNAILGGSLIQHFGLKEGKFLDEIKEKQVDKFLLQELKEKKPGKIFTHSIDDPHPDHQAVYKFVQDLTKKSHYRGDVYSFNVWNPINIRKRNVPKMVVDITETFQTKIKSFKVHRSQKMTLFTLLWNVYLRAILIGFNNHCRYAEEFYKIR